VVRGEGRGKGVVDVSDVSGCMWFGAVEVLDQIRGIVFHPGFEFPKVVFLSVGKFPGHEVFELSVSEFGIGYGNWVPVISSDMECDFREFSVEGVWVDSAKFGYVECIMDFPSRGELEAVGDVGDFLINLEWSFSLHIELLLGSSCRDVLHAEPDLVSDQELFWFVFLVVELLHVASGSFQRSFGFFMYFSHSVNKVVRFFGLERSHC